MKGTIGDSGVVSFLSVVLVTQRNPLAQTLTLYTENALGGMSVMAP